MGELQKLLLTVAKQLGSKQAAARAAGVTPQRFSRLLRGEFSLEVVNCLRLAKAANESPATVLRAAGKADVADLIEEAYGRVKPTLLPGQRELLEKWESLPPSSREHLRWLIDMAAASAGAKKRTA